MQEFIEQFLQDSSKESKQKFELERHILSYPDYLKLVAENPTLYLRDAACYIRDMFDFFGQKEVYYPWGAKKRFKLFDQEFSSKQESLLGEEEAQLFFYNVLQSFVRAGKPHKLILLHGPNGSSKTTFVSCIARGMEYFSNTPQGVLYRFNWVFPVEKIGTPGLGFIKGSGGERASGKLYAYLDESEIEAKLICELKDHPILLLLPEHREKFIKNVLAGSKQDFIVPDLIAKGSICPKCRLIFDALFSAYRGDLGRVYNHVQVERYTISRKYRRGFVTIGPQMAIDAGERQVTINRSLGALPKVLQNISLFEPFGELIDGSGGMIEFSDLLKRPIESFKYLLDMIETGEIQVGQSNQRINAVLVATCNEVHLNAFKQHPDALSFLGRINMIKIPYLLHEPSERNIYINQISLEPGKHIAPHSIEIASSWAVMTRLFKPDIKAYGDPVKNLIKDLMCTEKFDIYAGGKIPERFTGEEKKILTQSIKAIYSETENQPLYEGITGASPREIKHILYMAAQNPLYKCLIPLSVIEELENFIKKTKDYSFLNIERKEGHYHDFRYFIDVLKIRLIQRLLMEAGEASNLFSNKQFEEYWNNYILHATTYIKEGKILNPVTKKYEKPDESLMSRVESLLEVKDAKEFRVEVLNRIAAEALDKGVEKANYLAIFSRQIELLKSKIIKESIPKLKIIVEKGIKLLEKDGATYQEEPDFIEAKEFINRFQSDYGYCPECARVMLGYLMSSKLNQQ